MKRRPLSVTLVGWLFVLVNAAGVVDVLSPLFQSGGFARLRSDPIGLRDFWIVLSIRLIGAIGGAFVLAGANWARWLLAAWMAYHVILSLAHSWVEALMHAVIFSVLLYGLYRPASSRFFGPRAAM